MKEHERKNENKNESYCISNRKSYCMQKKYLNEEQMFAVVIYDNFKNS